MTQTDRVLAALSRAGARGITAVDFAAPRTCDAGPPIMRVAARVKDLRDAGIQIVTDGERDSCAVYKLKNLRAENPAQAMGGAPLDPEAGITPGRNEGMPPSPITARPAASSDQARAPQLHFDLGLAA